MSTLNAQIAEALGWTQGVDGAWYPPGRRSPDNLQRYDTDPVAADGLMTELRERGLAVHIEGEAEGWDVYLFPEVGDDMVARACGTTWTEALAKAALAALTQETP